MAGPAGGLSASSNSGVVPAKRLSKEEKRARVLAVTVELIESGELPITVELKVDRLIELAGVPRSSTRRGWTNETFYLDVIRALVDPERIRSEILDEESVRRAQAVLVEHSVLMADEGRRREVLRETVREAITHYFRTTYRSVAWRTYAVLTASMPSMGKIHIQDDAREILVAADGQTAEIFAGFYAMMLGIHGFRFKSGYDANIFAETVMGLIGGTAIRYTLGHRETDPLRLAGIGGTTTDWHPVAAGFLAIVEGMTELDPDFRPEGFPGPETVG
ncbi:hypothetical protein [Nocardia sp. NBC_01388]|uniref:hypothetical protein n=1 Tax=Nocardia sp. NBC_01388 TaxID=2903596 RepID=UPI003250D6BA